MNAKQRRKERRKFWLNKAGFAEKYKNSIWTGDMPFVPKQIAYKMKKQKIQEPTKEVPYWHYICPDCSKPIHMHFAWIDDDGKQKCFEHCKRMQKRTFQREPQEGLVYRNNTQKGFMKFKEVQ